MSQQGIFNAMMSRIIFTTANLLRILQQGVTDENATCVTAADADQDQNSRGVGSKCCVIANGKEKRRNVWIGSSFPSLTGRKYPRNWTRERLSHQKVLTVVEFFTFTAQVLELESCAAYFSVQRGRREMNTVLSYTSD